MELRGARDQDLGFRGKDPLLTPESKILIPNPSTPHSLYKKTAFVAGLLVVLLCVFLRNADYPAEQVVVVEVVVEVR